MTEKQDFLEKLNAALIERDISENDIAPYIERFDRFYDRMVRDTENTNGNLLDDIERIADNIAEQISERYDEMNRLAERTLTVDRVKEKSAHESEKPNTTSDPRASDEPQLETALSELEITDSSENKPEYIDEEPSPNSTVFWVLCAVSLPVTLPLALALLGIFLGVWAALAALIAASIASLVVVAAVGTALALVGVIYGISQLFSQLPVGLYELGLGIMIGSIAMFGGILIYNLAIRLLPLLMRLWGRFFGYVLRKLKMLFVFLRKECAKL